jgi:uncharacterized protein YggE
MAKNMETLEEGRRKFFKVLFVVAVFLVIFLAVKTIYEIKKTSLLGENPTPATISFSGHGEVDAVPDLATISFTIEENAPTVVSAQAKVTAKETAVLSFLNQSGIAKTDIKTDNYSSYPEYQYQNSVCPQPLMPPVTSGVALPSTAIYCPPSKQVLTGYDVSENISVQVHDVTKAGDIVTGVGAIGISNISGPNFSIENQDQLNEQARKLAIDDAKTKAKALASDLGVTLGQIVNFSDNSSSPIMYPQVMTLDAASVAKAPAPAMPAGENKITSDVAITYEIK